MSGVRFSSLTLRYCWFFNEYNNIIYENNNYQKKLLTNNTYNNIKFNNKFYKTYIFNIILKIIKFKLKGKTLKYKRISKSNIIFKFGLTHVINCWLLFTIYLKKKENKNFFF